MLHPLLVFDVLLNHFEWSTTNRGDKIGVGPQRRESRLEPRELLTQKPGRTAFDRTDQTMNAVLGIDFHEEMYMLGHDVQGQNVSTRFFADSLYNLFESSIDAVEKNGTAILWTPNNVIFA